MQSSLCNPAISHIQHIAVPAVKLMSACVPKCSYVRPLTALCSMATMPSAANATVANKCSCVMALMIATAHDEFAAACTASDDDVREGKCCHIWHNGVSGWHTRRLQLLDAAFPHGRVRALLYYCRAALRQSF